MNVSLPMQADPQSKTEKAAMPGSSTRMVHFQNVRKNFGAIEVLKGIDLEVSAGQVVALVGRSGSGKSTALRCVNGLEKIDGGELNVCGYDLRSKDLNLRELRQDVGIVFQSYNLFPHLTVEQNVTLAPRKVRRMGAAEARELAAEVLAQVGLSDKINAYPEQLSGGQQQRVAIARSLAMKPKLILFDEVTSALDPELTGEVLKAIERLGRKRHDHDGGHARDGLCPVGGKHRRIHAPGQSLGERKGRHSRQSADGRIATVCRQRALNTVCKPHHLPFSMEEYQC